jgi:uncharacterized membrane protein
VRRQLSQRLDDVPVWAVALLGGAALLLVPWSVALTTELPAHHVARHWDVAWAGFDAGLAIVLLATVAAAVRRSAWRAVIAGGAAAMLVCDAWFDIVTSSDQLDLWLAVAAAVAVELPLAGVCILVAHRSLSPRERGPAAMTRFPARPGSK